MKKILKYVGYLIGIITLIFIGSMVFIRTYNPTTGISTDILGLKTSEGFLQILSIHFWVLMIVGWIGIVITWKLIGEDNNDKESTQIIK